MCLTPLLCLCVEQLQPEDSLAELIHNVNPEECLDFLLVTTVKSKQGMYFLECAEVESAGISAALFVAGGYGSELAVPVLALLVARFEIFPSDGIYERVRDFPIFLKV